jgi:hypothetical protein
MFVSLLNTVVFNEVVEVLETNMLDPEVPPSVVIPAPHPLPGVDITIWRIDCRVRRMAGYVPGRFTLSVRRHSDGATLGTAIIGATRHDTDHLIFENTLNDLAPNFFHLAGDDSFDVRLFASGDAGPVLITLHGRVEVTYSIAGDSPITVLLGHLGGVKAALDAIHEDLDTVEEGIAEAGGELEAIRVILETPPPVRFVQVVWVSTGNYLIGLKSDGTTWKSTAPAASPLVWTQT